jgi:hypothetical protein
MRVAKKTYDAVSRGEPLVTRRQARKVKVDGAFTVTNMHTGEIQERSGIDAFKVRAVDGDGNTRLIGCPAPEGTTRTLRWHDKKATLEADRAGGNLPIIVTEAKFYEGKDGRPMWEITWAKVGPHRPIPDASSGIYLGPVTGYSSRSHSIDDEAPVIPDDHVRKFMADELAAKRDAQRRKLDAARKAVGEMLDDEELERYAHRLRQLLDKAENEIGEEAA